MGNTITIFGAEHLVGDLHCPACPSNSIPPPLKCDCGGVVHQGIMNFSRGQVHSPCNFGKRVECDKCGSNFEVEVTDRAGKKHKMVALYDIDLHYPIGFKLMTTQDHFAKTGRAWRELMRAIDTEFHIQRTMIWLLDRLNRGLVWIATFGRKR